MNKRILSLIVSVALVFAMMPVSAIAEDEQPVCSHLDTDGWTQTTSLPTESGSYILTADVTLTNVWQINSGTTINLCLNGHSITQTTAGRRAVYVKGGTLSIYDCSDSGTITGANVAAAGGGVRVDNGGTFNFHGGNITGNTVTGASSLGGGVYVTAATFNMDGGSITGNHADESSGGGVGMNGTATINITGGTISGNTAANGGGIMIQSKDNQVFLKDVLITGNTATVNGGGVYSGGTTVGQLTLSGNVRITGNYKGEALRNLYIANNATYDRTVILNNLGSGASIGVTVTDYTYPDIVSSGAKPADYSRFFTDGGTRILEYYKGTITLIIKYARYAEHAETEYVSCNHATTDWTPWFRADELPDESGNFYLTQNVSVEETLTVASGTDITICLNGKNIVTDGERVALVNGGTLKICDCTAATTDGTYTAGRLTGGENVISAGGCVRVENGGVFELYDGIISGNSSVSHGGGVYVKNAVFNMHGGQISGNTSATYGGGISTDQNATVNITGGLITGNTAVRGGGISVENTGEILLRDVTITANTATGTDETNSNHRGGGGIHLNANRALTVSGKVVITGNHKGEDVSNVIVDYNRVIIEDGLTAGSMIGVDAYPAANVQVVSLDDVQSAAYFTADDPREMLTASGKLLCTAEKPDYNGQHNSNHASGWTAWTSTDSLPLADGYYYLTADVNLTRVWNAGDGKEIIICLNGHNITQTTEGLRVMRIGASTVHICDCTAHTENGVYSAGHITASGTVNDDAGAMMLTGAGILRLYDGIVSDIHSTGNGTIVTQNGFDFEMHGGLISGNDSNKNGGAVYITGGSTFAMTGGEISDNEATGNGGALYVYNGTATLENSVIKDCSAATGGAAYVVNASLFTASDCSFEGCTSRGFGGALYLNSSTSSVINGSTFIACGAVNGGGIAVTYAGNANISGNTFTNCSATEEGSAVYLGGSSVSTAPGETVIGSNTYLGSVVTVPAVSVGRRGTAVMTGTQTATGITMANNIPVIQVDERACLEMQQVTLTAAAATEVLRTYGTLVLDDCQVTGKVVADASYNMWMIQMYAMVIVSGNTTADVILTQNDGSYYSTQTGGEAERTVLAVQGDMLGEDAEITVAIPAGGDIEKFVFGPVNIAGSGTSYIVTAGEDAPGYDPATQTEEHTYDIIAAGLTISEQFALTYYVGTDDAEADVLFYLNGSTDPVSADRITVSGGRYTLMGMTPLDVDTPIKTVIVDGNGTERYVSESFSIGAYIDSLYSAYANDSDSYAVALKSLLADVVRYSAELQKFNGTASEETCASEREWLSDVTAATVTAPTGRFSTVGTAGSKIKSGGLNAAEKISIYFIILKGEDAVTLETSENGGSTWTATDDFTLTARDGGLYVLRTEGLAPTQLDVLFRITVGGEKVVYSAESYINRKWNNAVVGDLVQAMYRYENSAKTFESIA